MNNKLCDFCRCELYPPHRTAAGIASGNLGTLKGLCYRCSCALESGKASARIIVSESKAMAQRAQERRVR